MPTWKAWDERQVRQRGSEAASTISDSDAISFTPMNPPQSLIGLNTQQSSPIPSSTAPAVPTVQTIVSTYLGRGEPETTAGLSQALQGTGTRKSGSGTRGKKRAATAQVATRASKRKKGTAAGDSPGVASQAKPFEHAGNGDYGDARSLCEEGSIDQSGPREVEAVANRSVPVYASSTSMDALQTSIQQTSVRSVKEIIGRRKTLYRRPPTGRHEVVSVSYAEPLLGKGQSMSADRMTPKVGRKEEVTIGNATKSWLGDAEREVGQVDSGRGVSKQPWKSPRHEPIIWTEDDFPDDFEDDSINDADILALAETVDTTSKMEPTSPEQSTQTRRDSLEPAMPPAKRKLPTNSSDGLRNSVGEDPEVADIVARVEARLNAVMQVADSLLGMPPSSDAITASDWPKKYVSKKQRATQILTPDEDFWVLDDDLVPDLTSGHISSPAPPTPPPRDRKLNMHEVSSHEDYGGALLTSDEVDLLAQLKPTTPAPTGRPIVRPPFPSSLLDRSPCYGATPSPVLRTCFRIGEALKAGAQAVRANKPVIVELFCSVGRSWREEKKQHFEFRDLYFPEKPPLLEGTWEVWSGRRLWAAEGRLLLEGEEGKREERKMCRVIGRVKRGGKGWKMEVLGAMEVGWEDVKFVAGVYCVT